MNLKNSKLFIIFVIILILNCQNESKWNSWHLIDYENLSNNVDYLFIANKDQNEFSFLVIKDKEVINEFELKIDNIGFVKYIYNDNNYMINIFVDRFIIYDELINKFYNVSTKIDGRIVVMTINKNILYYQIDKGSYKSGLIDIENNNEIISDSFWFYLIDDEVYIKDKSIIYKYIANKLVKINNTVLSEKYLIKNKVQPDKKLKLETINFIKNKNILIP